MMDICFMYKVPSTSISGTFESKSKSLKINNALNSELIFWKNKLNYNRNWDIAKRITNKYEFIFSSGYTKINLVKKKPLSRAYFKLWEILHDFNIIDTTMSTKTSHIADGPGGFIECVCDYYAKYDYMHGGVSGITLRSNDKKIPNWKVSKDHVDKFNVKL